MKKVLAYMLAFVMILSCFAGIELTAKAEGENILSVNQTFDVEPTDGVSATYQFTPDEDGTYVFYSDNINTGYFNLFSSEIHLSTSVWDENDYLVLDYSMTAGETYYFSVQNDDDEAGSVTLIMKKPATNVYLNKEVIEGYVGSMITFEIGFGPMFSLEEAYTLSSENEQVASFNEYDELELLAAGSTTITVTTESGLTDTCAVTVKEPIALELDKVTTVQHPEADSSVFFKFTPSKTAQYVFYSDIDVDTGTDVYGYIYSMDGVEIASDDDGGEDLNFVVKAELEANVTYRLESYLYPGDDVAQYDVVINELKAATEMNFEKEQIVGYVGGETYTIIQFGPGIVADESFEITSTDDSVVSVYAEPSGDVYLEFLAEGTATITATSLNGLTCTCDVIVLEPISISLDDEMTVQVLEGQYSVKYVFQPSEDAEYVFYSTDGNNGYVELAAEDGSWLAYNYGGASNNNFKLCYSLQAGETYYYTCNVPEEVDNLSVVLKKATEATAISFEYEEMTLFVDDGARLALGMEPANGVANVSYESSDEDVAYVHHWEGEKPYVFAGKVGTATVTATTDTGLTATCTITVKAIPEIKVNDTETIHIEADYQMMAYTFTPEQDGEYILASEDAEDIVYIVIFDEEQNNTYKYDCGDEDEENATIKIKLKAGVKYRIYTGFDESGKTGSYTFKLYDAANLPIEQPDDTNNNITDDSNNSAENSKVPAPATGDSQMAWIWVALMVLAISGAVAVVIIRKKNK